MKKIQKLLSCFIACLSCSHCAAERIEVQGHRGSRGTFPENSLPGFEAAIAAGADVLEIDLLLSKEGTVFIHHNFAINSELSTYVDGTPLANEPLICELNSSELKNIDCGSRANPKFPQQKALPGTEIPTLQELFDLISSSSLANAKNIRLNLEIKRDPRYPHYTPPAKEIAATILSLVRKNKFSKRVYYSSFDPEVLGCLRALDSKAVLGFIYSTDALEHMEKLYPGNGFDHLLFLLSSINIQIISPQHRLLQKAEDVQKLKQAGLRVIPWTINDPKRWEELVKMGVDGLITDYPEQLIGFLKDLRD